MSYGFDTGFGPHRALIPCLAASHGGLNGGSKVIYGSVYTAPYMFPYTVPYTDPSLISAWMAPADALSAE